MPLLSDAIDLKIGNTQVLSAFMNGVLVWPSGTDSLSAAEPPPSVIKASFDYYDQFKPTSTEYTNSLGETFIIDGYGGYRDVETCLELVGYTLPVSGYQYVTYYAEAPFTNPCGGGYGYGYAEDPAWQIQIEYTMTPTFSGWSSSHGAVCFARFGTFNGPGNSGGTPEFPEPGTGDASDIYSPYGEYTNYIGDGTYLEVTEVVNLTADCPPDECQSVYNEFVDYLNIAGGDISCSVDEAIPVVQTTSVQTITSVNKTDYTQQQLDDFTTALSARYMQLNPTATEINIEIT